MIRLSGKSTERTAEIRRALTKITKENPENETLNIVAAILDSKTRGREQEYWRWHFADITKSRSAEEIATGIKCSKAALDIIAAITNDIAIHYTVDEYWLNLGQEG